MTGAATVHKIGRGGSKVEHWAVWAYDRPGEGLFEGSGRYVPLCGQRRVDGHWQHTTPEDDRRACSRCSALVRAMAAA